MFDDKIVLLFYGSKDYKCVFQQENMKMSFW